MRDARRMLGAQRVFVDTALRRLRVGAALLLTVWLVVPPRHVVGGLSGRVGVGVLILTLLGCNAVSLMAGGDGRMARVSGLVQLIIDGGIAFAIAVQTGAGVRGVVWIALSLPVLEAAMRFGLVGEALTVSLVGGAYAAWSWWTGAADVATVGMRVSAVLLVGLPCGYFASQMAAELHSLSAVTQRLAYRASHDPLTGLANRAFLLDRLDRVAAVASAKSPLALFFVDLDGFKAINDTFGHDVGDEALVVVAARLRDAAPDAFVARLGGDEFAALAWPTSAAGAEATAQRVVDAVRYVSHDATLTVSVGLAMSYGDVAPPQLLRQADLAMYEAKTAGRARWTRHDERHETDPVLAHR